MRKWFNLFLSVVVAFAPWPSFAGYGDPIKYGRNFTAASLTREKYSTMSQEFEKQDTDQLFFAFAEAFHSYALQRDILQQLPSTPASQIHSTWITPVIRTWINGLILSRQGFPQEAAKHIAKGMIQAATSANFGINRYDYTVEQFDEVFAAVIHTTLKVVMEHWYNLKDFERERIFTGIKEAAQQMRSQGSEKAIVKPLGEALANDSDTDTKVILGAVCTGAAAAAAVVYYCMPDVRGLDIAALNLAIGTIVWMAVGLGTGFGTWNLVKILGRHRAKYRSLKNVSQSCEKLLSDSGEILL